MVENRTPSDERILRDDEKKENEWDFYFGRGGASNQKRQVSKANNLVQDLALQYSKIRQTEKRIFAKIEVYDVVLRNGGHFLMPINKELVDVTNDEDEAVRRIMQNFRDINKTRSTVGTNTSDRTTFAAMKFGNNQEEKAMPPNATQKSKSTSESIYSAKFGRKEIIEQRTPRPKRRCVRPSIIEPPIIQNAVGNSMVTTGPTAVFDVTKNKLVATSKRTTPLIGSCVPHANGYGYRGNDIREISMHPMSANLQGAQQPSLETTGGTPGPCLAPANSTTPRTTHQPVDEDDAFDNKIVVEPPRLENSFSQWIMTDEIRPNLPTDSQQSINLNLHSRVQRLENLVAMLMQQKNDEMELLLENSSTNPSY